MPAEEERMLVADMVVLVEGSDEVFSDKQVLGECFSADEESIEKELLARIPVIPVLADVGVESSSSRERFLRLRG